jgi:hypothetical protein
MNETTTPTHPITVRIQAPYLRENFAFLRDKVQEMQNRPDVPTNQMVIELAMSIALTHPDIARKIESFRSKIKGNPYSKEPS